MRSWRTFFVASMVLLAAGPLSAGQDAAVITSFSSRRDIVVGRGKLPASLRPGSLAGAVDSDGHVRGILRFLSRSNGKLQLEIVDSLWPGSVMKGLEIRFFDTTGGEGLAVWTEEWGARLSVDGRSMARLPAILVIKHGTHELTATLTGGVAAGVRVTAPVDRDSLCLHGIGWPLGNEHAMKLTRNPPADPSAPLSWVEVPGYGRFYHSGGPVTAPEKLEIVPPEYPEALRRNRVEGWATFLVLVGADGTVKALARVAQSNDAFAVVGTRVVRGWTFKPATLDGQAVPGIFPLTLQWRLTGPLH